MWMTEIIKKEWQGFAIEFEEVNGQLMANATSMCMAFGKKPGDWLRLPVSERYKKALKAKCDNLTLVKTRKGGTNPGTWIHEKLILKLAQWLSVDFEIQCDEWLAELLRTGKVELAPLVIKEPSKRELMEMWLEQEKQNEELLLVNASQAKQLALNAPKVAAHDQLISSAGNILVREAAKLFNFSDLGEKKLFEYLRTTGVLSSSRNTYNQPHQTYVNHGFFRLVTRTFTTHGSGRTESTTYVTPAGLVYLKRRIEKAGYKPRQIKTLKQAATSINQVTSAIQKLGGSFSVATNFLPL